MDNQNGVAIAIIGMAGKFPGAGNVEEFWKNLRDGVESIGFFTEEELMEEGELPERFTNSRYVKANAFVKNKEFFDSTFFGYSPTEATLMDPQMRIFHEICWKALEDAGIDIENNSDKIGLFAGGSTNLNWQNYSFMSNQNQLVNNFSASQLRDITFLCSRVSYALNLQGPSIFLNTACSTSLVAIQRAALSLLLRECRVALAGGITINNHSKRGYMYEDGMIQSRDGHCRAFDSAASGTVVGEGAGVVVLKRLKDAVADGDRVHAVIKGSGVNNDGNGKVGYTAPSLEGEATAILSALKLSKVPVESIGMLEAHGTGTSLGDPIEVEALNLAYGKSPEPYCALGSVKTNVGHLDVAAGVTGLIKAVLSIKHRQIPASLHYVEANPEIDFDGSPFYVNTSLREWSSDGYPLRAGVSSFGIGGTNAHVILEEAPEAKLSGGGRSSELFVFSAKSAEALERNMSNFGDYLRSDPACDVADMAYTLARGRSPFAYRKSIVCSSKEELLARFESPDKSKASMASSSPELVFMFTGQGAQYLRMYAGLYEREPYFKEEVDRCLSLVKTGSGLDLRPILFGGEEGTGADLINETRYAQPLLFIVEYALSRLVMSWGLSPDRMVGHSIGEYVAACLSGVFSLEDALQLVVKRGELMQGAPKGDMLGIGISEEDLVPYLVSHPLVSLAAVNSSSHCVVSGTVGAIKDFKKAMRSAGHASKLLKTSHGFHSHLMDGILDEFKKVLAKVKINAQEIPFISNLSGKTAKDSDIGKAGYWVDHLRKTVRFSDSAATLLSSTENMVFVEMGSGRALGTFVRAHGLRGVGHHVVSLASGPGEDADDLKYLLSGIGKVWSHGIVPDWGRFYNGQVRRKVSLPTYSFEKVKYPVNVDAFQMLSKMLPGVSAGKRKDIPDWFYAPSWKLSPFSDPSVRDVGCVLLFGNDHVVFEGIADRYAGSGAKVVHVRPGGAFNEESPFRYTLDPSDPEGYRRLFERLSAQGLAVDQVVHGWGTGDQDGEGYTEGCASLYFFSLLEAVRSWPSTNGSPRSLTVVTSGLHPVLGEGGQCAPKSLSLGLIKVLSQEYTGLSCNHIDIDPSEDISGTLLGDLYGELRAEGSGRVVSFRHGRKWGEIFEPLEGGAHVPVQGFRDGGTYLITGGMGNLGKVLSSYLLKEFGANLILLGRSVNPVMEDFQSFGDKVLYIDCDISEVAAVREAVAVAEERFGTVHGVVHAAGVVSGNSINTAGELSAADFQAQFGPKITGVETLGEIFGPRELDFCILVSSLSTVLGGLGFGAYGPANIYMDYYAGSGHGTGRFKNWLSLDLDGLDFTGDAGEHIGSGELIGVLEHGLAHLSHGRLVVSTGDLGQRYGQWVSPRDGGTALEGDRELPGLAGDGDVVEGGGTLSQGAMLELWRQVLGKPDLGLDDDFFEMGGDSLKALTLVGRAHKRFGAEISVKEFFERPTVRELDGYLASRSGQGRGKDYTGIPAAPPTEHYPLSYAQNRLYFLNQFDADALAYNIPEAITLKGKLNLDLFNEAVKNLIHRHESLRTSFAMADGRPVQRVEEGVQPDIEHFEGGDVGDIVARFIRPFDLSRAPLMRMGLITAAPDEHVLVVDMHHIVSDGVSRNILVRDFMSLYNGGGLPELGLRYRDYAVWQQGEAQQREIRSHGDFWLGEYKEEVDTLELPSDFPRPPVKQYDGARLDFSLSAEQTSGLKELAEGEGATMFMLLFAAYGVLLGKLGNQEDLVIGVPTAGREHAELEDVLGMFVNTLPVRTTPRGEMSFREYLAAVREKTLSCFEHQSYPYEELIDRLDIKRDTAHNPLFDVVFSYQNYQQTELSIKNINCKILELNQVTSKFDLTLDANEKEGNLNFTFEYATAVFNKETIKRFSIYFKRILKSILENPTVSLKEIELISVKERKLLLRRFNKAESLYPSEKTVVDLFEEQVKRTPDGIAVSMENTHLSYKELNEKSDKLASSLLKRGVKSNSIVAILMDRSIEVVIGMLGILKAGGAYLPIDIDYPKERIDYLIEDSSSRLILMSRRFQYDLQADIDFLYIEDDEEMTDISLSNNKIKPEDICYIIYTSGTTGNPKGVMVEHRNLVRLFFNDKFQFDFGSEDIWTMFHSQCFDFSVWEMYGALLFGGKLIVIPKKVAIDSKTFIKLLREEGVTVLNQTPSSFYNLAREENEILDNDLKLNYVIFGGEALSPGNLKNWHAKYPNVKLINMFGITETTVHVTYKEIGEFEIFTNSSNIGKPIPTLFTYILDKNLKLVPQGVTGELYVGGAGVSRGYLGKEDLTKAKFINDPHRPDSRLYRSGDLMKYDENGDLFYVGRIDDQVKIRGFRIELAEIESQLLAYRDIKEVVVLVKNDKGDKFLVAYYVSDKFIESSDLRFFLLEKLPDYMVPSFYVHLQDFTLTGNGKLDKKSLPDYRNSGNLCLRKPVDAVEKRLVEIWSETLGVDKTLIGTNISFFELGGHSLNASVLVNKIFKEFGIEIPIKEIFRNPEIVYLSNFLKETEPSLFKSIPTAAPTDYYGLSFAQRRLYFLQEFDGGSTAYNMTSALRLSGDLDRGRLSTALEGLLARHEVLRTCFDAVDGSPVQRVDESAELVIEEIPFGEGGLSSHLRDFVRPFDLSRAPLMRVGLILTGGDGHVLMVDIHHIVCDGISRNILIRDFMSLYNGSELPEQGLQYKDYAAWQQSSAQRGEILSHRDFWLGEYSEEVPVLALPADFPRPLVKEHAGGELGFALDPSESSALRKLAERNGVTPFMLMFSAFSVLLGKLGNADDVVVGVPTAGRDHAELEDVLGMFVNTLPVRIAPRGELGFGEFLKAVKNKTLSCFEHQSYPYEELIEDLDIKRDTGRNPMFDVMFSYQNYEQTAFSVEGMEVGEIALGDVKSKFDLTLEVTEQGDRLKLRFEYATGIFERGTIERFASYYRRILASVVEDPTVSLKDIVMIGAAERDLLLHGFNDTSRPYPSDRTVVDLFEEQAALSPESTAVSMGPESLTYRELNNKANAIAKLLNNELKNKVCARVALLFNPSIELIACMLGILKIGGTYIPLMSNAPIKRNKTIIKDCEADALLAQPDLLGEKRKGNHIGPAKILQFNDKTFSDTIVENPIRVQGANELIYILYTSGTTGKPKGVEVKHAGITNMLYAHRNIFKTYAGMKSSQVANIGFDASAFEIWPCLSSGGSLYIADKEIRQDPELMHSWLEKNKIEISYQPTVVAEFLLTHVLNTKNSSLKIMTVAGDKFNYFPNRSLPFKLYNLYGPTEDSIWTTYRELKYDCQFIGYSIGKPIANKKIYILDVNNNLQPLGVFGELCISGNGLAKGYLNNKKLTKQKFLENPFNTKDNIYKTGDLARWRVDGNLEFVGRLDNQVKIRGNRIELSEIQNKLIQHKDILQSSVILIEKEKKKLLVAYYTSEAVLEAGNLKKFLSAELPDYMIPTFFTKLDDIPLTSSGKIDKKALPIPEANISIDYAKPESLIQEKLVKIWADLLNTDISKISVSSNFFDMGGHSISIVMMRRLIKTEFGINIPVAKLFGIPTIISIEDFILNGGDNMKTVASGIDNDVEEATRTLSFLNNTEDI